jgi:hypothetical protein
MLDLGLDDIADLLALAENGCPGRQPEYRETLDRHLHTIEQRIQHLLGLRAAIRQLLAREGASCGDEAGRTSCGCMEISGSRLAPERPAARPADEPVDECCLGKGNGRACS